MGNCYATGVRRFALAGWIASTDELEDLRVALGMPLTVVSLTLSLEEIERRLSASITTGRQDDLRVAREWLAEGRGDDIGDVLIESDRQIREVALDILSALCW